MPGKPRAKSAKGAKGKREESMKKLTRRKEWGPSDVEWVVQSAETVSGTVRMERGGLFVVRLTE